MKKFIVAAVDSGETCDGKARILGAFDSMKEAKSFVHEDMDQWIANHKDEGVECNYDKMSAWFDYDTSDGCEWSIGEVEL